MNSWLIDVRGQAWNHVASLLSDVADRVVNEAVHVELCVNKRMAAELGKLAAYLNIEDHVDIIVEPRLVGRRPVNGENPFGKRLLRTPQAHRH